MTEESIVFYGNRVADIRIQDTLVNTLQARMGTGGGNMPLVCYPIADGRELNNKNQNGTGVGQEGDPMFTINTVDHHAVAFTQNQRDEVRDLGGIAGALQAEPGMHQQTFIASEQSQQIVNAANQTASVVRRLTPTECERLQGFPDGWTEGQADTHRYKQMGNAVAVPVVEWIMERLVANDKRNKSDVV